MVSRDEILRVARSWLGTPYRHQGRNRRGVDCIGLIWVVSRDLGLPTPSIPNDYGQTPRGRVLLDGCERHLVKVPTGFAYGSVCIFYGTDVGQAQHFAIIGKVRAYPTMVHAFSKTKCVTEGPIDRFWQPRLIATYEFPDTEGVQVPAPGA